MNNYNESSNDKTMKYIIIFTFTIDGIVDKSDIVGAIFGQTEGIFGPTFDLRELAKNGKIGRIQAYDVEIKNRKTTGFLKITTTKEIEATALIAALIETVDKVGPYKAQFRFKDIIDIREEKIKEIERRAREILDKWRIKKLPKAEEILDDLRKRLQDKHPIKIIKIDGETLAAGQDFDNYDEIILVEGRADVANLVKYGINNVLSIGGGKIPEKIRDIVKGKTVIAFLDGDRGGVLNLRKLMQTVKVDYITLAPEGKEVEELKYDEIVEALKNKKPTNIFLIEKNKEIKDYKDLILRIAGKLSSLLLDKDRNIINEIPVSDLVEYLDNNEVKADTLILDGIITQRLLDIAEKREIKLIIGIRRGVIVREPKNIKIITFGE